VFLGPALAPPHIFDHSAYVVDRFFPEFIDASVAFGATHRTIDFGDGLCITKPDAAGKG
jgi:hypothetical protein